SWSGTTLPLAVTRRITAGAMHSTMRSDAIRVQRTSSRRVYSFTPFASRFRVSHHEVEDRGGPRRVEGRGVGAEVDGAQLGAAVGVAEDVDALVVDGVRLLHVLDDAHEVADIVRLGALEVAAGVGAVPVEVVERGIEVAVAERQEPAPLLGLGAHLHVVVHAG